MTMRTLSSSSSFAVLTTISSMIMGLFHNNKLDIDPRSNIDDFDYILTISLPTTVTTVTTVMTNLLGGDGVQILMGQQEQEDLHVWKFGINFPIMIFWFQLAMFLSLLSLVTFVTGTLTWYFIVQPRRRHRRQEQEQQQQQQQQQSMPLFLITFGCFVPALLYVPFALNHILQIKNCVLLISIVGPLSLCIFRTIEAYFGTSPMYVEQNYRNFILYHVTPVPFNFDSITSSDDNSNGSSSSSSNNKISDGNNSTTTSSNHSGGIVDNHTAMPKDNISDNNYSQKRVTIFSSPRPASKKEIIHKLCKFGMYMIHVTILINLFVNTDFELFPRRKQCNNLSDYFYWGNLAHNYTLAYMTGIYLEAGTLICGIGVSLATGVSTVEFNDNPLTKSQSVSEFWGQRWNRVVGGLLRRSIFKPIVQNGYSKQIAVMATFLASGLLHEYILAFVGLKGTSNYSKQHGGGEAAQYTPPRYFLQTAFFLWNGCLLILENALFGSKRDNDKKDTGGPVRLQLVSLATKLPRYVKTFFVVMTALPFAHWFLDEYIHNDIYTDFAVAMFRVVKL